jgi:hypothetical protein
VVRNATWLRDEEAELDDAVSLTAGLGHVWIKAAPAGPDDGQDWQVEWTNLILPGV